MTPRQQIFALVLSVGLLIFTVEMVRRRKLREEYSWLWIVTAFIIVIVSLWFGLVEWLTPLIGAVVPVSTLFMFGIFFLLIVNIYFSMKISTLTTQVKNLAQRLAIVDHYLQERHLASGKMPNDEAVPADVETTTVDPQYGQDSTNLA